MQRHALLVAASIVAFAARVIDLGDTLWFDELWSRRDALNASSAGELLRVALAQNSHLLVAFWMDWLGASAPAWLYRLPSFVYSALTLLLAIALGRDLEGPRGAWIYACVFGLSAFLIHYGTEARGYSGLLFHSLLGFSLLSRSLDAAARSPVRGGLFGVNALFGLLSHPIFGAFLSGAGLWLALRLLRGLARTRSVDRALLGYAVSALGLPASAVLATRAAGVALQTQPDGPEASLLQVWLQFLHYGFGVPESVPSAIACTVALGALSLLAYASASDRLQRSRVELLALLAIAPIAVLALSGSSVLYPRYLAPALPCLYVLGIRGALALCDRSAQVRWAVTALLLLYFTGQASVLVPMLRHGRGQYLEALREMAARDASALIRVGVDQPFRNAMVIDYFATKLDEPRRFEVVPLWTILETQPRWILFHRIADEGPTPDDPLHDFGLRYERVGTYAKSGPSGWHWFLYGRTRPAQEP